jgi:tryptophan-rich sensory protein
MTTVTANEPSRRDDIAVLVFLVVLCLIAGGVGSVATAPNIPTWYAGLNKPWFNPPNSVFPVVWTALYVLMAVAAWIAWRQPATDMGQRWLRLVPFFVQLVVNVGWSFAFFGAHSALAGLVVIALLILALLWTIGSFARVSRGAAALLVLYLAWVLFATVLNVAIFMLN